MTGYEIHEWSDFALAQLGASAALLGLVFVGLSINLRDVISNTSLVNRAAEAVIALAGVLVAATCVLIPNQSRTALTIELLVIGVVLLATNLRLQRADFAPTPADHRDPPRASRVLRHVLGIGTPLLLIVAAVTLAAEGGGGLYWWPAAIVAAYAAAISNAWVLLIEILR